MGELIVKNKDIVVPGEELATGMDYLPAEGTYRYGDVIRASRIGLVMINGRAIKIIPLAGRYLPKKGDNIIGKIIDITMAGWRIDFNCAYTAMLQLKDATSDFIPKGADLTKIFDIGDYIMAKIVNVTSQNLVDISTKGPGLRKLKGGRIFSINTTKVPRVIGKNGSMVSMIKDYTKCKIMVGQNGLIWIDGEPEMEHLAVQTIKKIEEESHISGLTDKIKQFLEEKITELNKKKDKKENIDSNDNGSKDKE